MNLPSFDTASTTTVTTLDRRQLSLALVAAIVVSIALGFVPWGRTVIYPFGLLATWAHELGHGLGALITGNRFHRLEVYRDLGGVAFTSGADGLGQVVVSSLGLIGPALLGAGIMIAGSRPRTAPWVLGALSTTIALSCLIWIRNGFGFVAMALIAAGLAGIARFGTPLIRVVVAQLVAVQLALAAWSTRDYLFVDGFERDGFQVSDTGKIADELGAPYWFWGALLGGLSVVVLCWAFWVAWIRPLLDQPTTP